jgi:prophage regulatory protein
MRVLDHDGLRQKGIRFSNVQLWRKVREGSFPRPIKLGANRNAWIEQEIDDWLTGLMARRDGSSQGPRD